MEVTSEMQVDFIHGENLGITAAGCSALHSEARSQGRLTQCSYSLPACLCKAQGQADRHSRLSDACLCRGDGSHQYQFTLPDFFFVNKI